uniref:hypothetical protein n=1 Tax=Prevotella sp. TaxID=59823 RepID=UPI004024D2A8
MTISACPMPLPTTGWINKLMSAHCPALLSMGKSISLPSEDLSRIKKFVFHFTAVCTKWTRTARSCVLYTYVSLGGPNGCADQLTNWDGTQKLGLGASPKKKSQGLSR